MSHKSSGRDGAKRLTFRGISGFIGETLFLYVEASGGGGVMDLSVCARVFGACEGISARDGTAKRF